MRPVLILFAKDPVAGCVKTRLCPPLQTEAAAELHRAFVADLLDRLAALPVALELHTDKQSDAWPGAAVTRRLQIPGDLGLRMFHALNTALRAGHPRAMIVGADLPTVPLSHLEQLLHPDADVAFGPAEDGGYYAIAAQRVDPRMFDGVEWSGPQSLAQSVAACARLGFSVAIGSPWFDVDTVDDLRRLLADPDLPPSTRVWAAQHGSIFHPGASRRDP
jgi:rSAM/selenodomain-associated transferase 1